MIKPLRPIGCNGAVLDLIEIADRLGWCTEWHCGTCAASNLRRGLEQLLGREKAYPAYLEADMERLAEMLSELVEVRDSGAAEALLLLVSRKLGYQRTSAILGESPAASHYKAMWAAHLIVENKRDLHRQLSDPGRVATERANKKKIRAEQHALRIAKYKAMRPKGLYKKPGDR